MPKQIIKDSDGLARIIHILSNLDLKEVWQIDWKKYVRNRSAEQNRLMWSWHVIMADYFGLTKNKTHHVVMEELLAPINWEYGGKTYEVYSTKVMNVKQMTNFLNMYHTWAHTDHGVNLPLPDDQHYR